MKLPSVNTIVKGMRRLATDERGAEGLEKLLIVGALVIPLLGLLIYFREQLETWLFGQWEDVENDANTQYDSNSGPN